MIELKQGAVLSLARMHAWSKAVNTLVEQPQSFTAIEKVAVLHKFCLDCANYFGTRIHDVIPSINSNILTADATIVIGVHVSPHALGIAALIARRE
jgi:hypothetical protein